MAAGGAERRVWGERLGRKEEEEAAGGCNTRQRGGCPFPLVCIDKALQKYHKTADRRTPIYTHRETDGWTDTETHTYAHTLKFSNSAKDPLSDDVFATGCKIIPF